MRSLRETAVISEEARAILERSRPLSIPLLPITPRLARAARKRAASKNAPLLQSLQRDLLAGVDRRTLGGVEVVEILPKDMLADSGDYIIYLHGGAFMFGDACDALSMLLAAELHLPVISIQYSLSPEVAFPVALDECVSAYRAITAERPGRHVLAGISAGGNLALGLMQRVRDEGLRGPAALGLMTPAADLAYIGDSYSSNARRDPVIKWRNQVDKALRSYVGAASLSDALVSPIHAHFSSSFPPSLIISGTRDLFLSNCVRLERVLLDAGASARLMLWEGMWHAFIVHPDVPEAQQARSELGLFFSNALSTAHNGSSQQPRGD